jgi:hypothetical protein
VRRNTVFITNNINSGEIFSEICSNNLLVLPKNSGLGEFRQKLEELPNEKIVVRAEDVPLFLELLAIKEKAINSLETKINERNTIKKEIIEGEKK